VPNIIWLLGAGAAEVMDLRAIARSTSSGRSSGEDKSTSYSLIVFVCQTRKAAELRNRRRPEVICALNDVRNMGRNLIGVLLGKR
jgi:hypothetical protein